MVKMTLTKRQLIISLLLFLLPASVFALSAEVDRSKISEGSSFTLTITLDHANVNQTPDFSALKKQFTILSTGKSTEISIINGKSASKTEWALVLVPNGTGELSIPPIIVGNDKTKPIVISVLPAKKLMAEGQYPKTFFETQLSSQNSYPQAQVIYTVWLYNAQSIEGASLTDPQLANAIIRPLDQENYQAKRGNHVYEVIKRRYAIFPETSGDLTIEPPVLNGAVVDSSQASNTAFGLSQFIGNSGRPIQLVAPTVKLRVLPQPKAFTGSWWLPAQKLTLTESWSSHPLQFKVGEPVTRTITLTAQGLNGSQLPNLPNPVINNSNVYPDKPISKTSVHGDTVVGTKSIKTVFVPTQAGKLSIPDVTVPWWNVKTNQEQTATLMGKTLTVVPSAVPKPAVLQPTVSAPTQSSVSPAPAAAIPVAVVSQYMSFWPWLVAAGVFIIWLVTLFAWWRQKKRPGQVLSAPIPIPIPVEMDEQQSAIKQACLANNPKQARVALLAWGRQHYSQPAIRGLADLAQCLSSEELKTTMLELDRVLYAGDPSQWHGESLWRLLIAECQQQKTKGETVKEDPLPSLYLR